MHLYPLSKMTRLLTAVVLIACLVGLAAQDLVPQMSYAKLAAYVLLGAVVFAVNLVGLSVIYLNIYQWVLRQGGTDTAWFWFSSEPKGLESLRDKLPKV
jgi:hypothetical protein